MSEKSKDKSKYSNQQYKFICEMLWGGVPVDRNWAEGTNLFKSEANKILEKYPMLDKSFFKKELKDCKSLDEVEDNDLVVELFNSEEFKKNFEKQVNKDTWDKNLPKVYMNDKGQVVKHWKDGKIKIIKDK